VASIAARDLADAARLVARAPAKASAIEYRLDLAEEAIPVERLMALDRRPVVVTWRSVAEGGRFSGSAEDYLRLARAAYAAGATVDIEHARGLLDAAGEFPDRRRVVVSLHTPFGLPPDVGGTIAAMRASRAHALKLVAGAAELPAALELVQIQRREGDGSLAVSPMGPASPPGRVLCALFGGSLVYGPVEQQTASGQISLEELFEVYGVDRPRRLEALFGIVGSDVSGSLSPALHNRLFAARDLPWLYLPLPVGDFARVKPHEIVFDPPFRGLSVTQPWKLAAAAAGRPSADVTVTNAANTLVRERGGWRAENTDVDGIFDPLADHDTGEGRAAVILGAGGAARAAVVAARKLGYEVLLASRRNEEADAVARELSVDSLAWEDVPASEADLYVNATPVGWRDDDAPVLPKGILAGRPLVFDCVYRKDGMQTSTIRAARAARCPVVEGIQMFAAQAARQAALFGVEGVTAEEIAGALKPTRSAA
jgi:3-dehydroquinate dehydratase/shikimate dehydrogenase